MNCKFIKLIIVVNYGGIILFFYLYLMYVDMEVCLGEKFVDFF